MKAKLRVKFNIKRILRRVAFITFFGVFISSALSADETVQINFRDADIRSVIESLAEITSTLPFFVEGRSKSLSIFLNAVRAIPGPLTITLLFKPSSTNDNSCFCNCFNCPAM